MEKKEIVIENPVVIRGVTLVPIVRVLMNSGHGKGGYSFFSVKQPVAVIVVSPAAKRVLRVTGEEISVDELIQEAPAIKEELGKIA